MISTTDSADRRPQVVVVAPDVVGRYMAGPGLRFASIAEQLSRVADVTLAVGVEGSDVSVLLGRGFQVRAYADRDELVALICESDVAFCQLIDEHVVRQGLNADTRFIFDLYNALPAEAIGAERIGGFDTQPQMDDVFTGVLSFFRFCMRAGSYFVTSNERQRDFWIGYMLASEGLLPSELDGRHAGDVIGLLPFGMDEADPVTDEKRLRGQDGIRGDDFILLWAGGIWDWFDAETPIRAIAGLRTEHPDIRLVFYGTTHPNPLIGRPKAVEGAMALAEELGVLGNGVHFVDGWVPASERAGFLLDADAAISAHKESFETRYAFRTRILDHFWARLPSIVTEGDWFADYIEANALGVVVPYGNVSATSEAILSLRDASHRREIADRVDAIRGNWRWERTTLELRNVIVNRRTSLRPRRLPDPPVHAAPAPRSVSRVRRLISSSALGALYRQVRRRGPR